MEVKILIEVPLKELKEYMDDYYECNGERISLLEAKQMYIETFLADRSDYIDMDKIHVHFV